MTSSTSHISSRAIKRPPFKRRKLLSTSNLADQHFDDGHAFTKLSKPSTCTSCHRALNGRANQTIFCSRCNSPTCTICSRTCNACPSSLPPTPRLSYSPTPPATPEPSPRRVALSLSTTHVNVNGGVLNTTPTAGRRRKVRDGEDDDGVEDGSENCEKDMGELLIPGCGRTICRNCCFENPQSNTTTCCDCYGRA